MCYWLYCEPSARIEEWGSNTAAPFFSRHCYASVAITAVHALHVAVHAIAVAAAVTTHAVTVVPSLLHALLVGALKCFLESAHRVAGLDERLGISLQYSSHIPTRL